MGQLRLLGEPPASDDHAALTNLAYAAAAHTGFVAAAGLAGGQTVIGGTAASQHLTLQSTAHATRGYVRAQDDLQLLSNILRDSTGTQRLALGTTSPYVTLGNPTAFGGGDALIWGKLGLGDSSPAIGAGLINIKGAGALGSAGILIQHGLATSIPAQEVWGLGGLCNLTGAGNLAAGLRFNAYFSGGSSDTLAALEGIRVGIFFNSVSTTTLTSGAGIRVLRPAYIFGSRRRADTQYGIVIEDQFCAVGYNVPTTVYGLKIDDISGGTNRYLLELGPATPYLRLLAGAAPGANLTNLYLAEGAAPTLRRVQWVDPGAGGANLVAGQRVLVLV